MNKDLVLEMAPTGTLRVALNMINFLLISGKNPEGVPVGVAPDLARTIADRLGVPLQLIQYGSPGELADDADKNVWDIGLIGAEPVRAQKID
nr:transporter substrate-binding domain-containing protein [Burkholderiaceae bacterium]